VKAVLATSQPSRLSVKLSLPGSSERKSWRNERAPGLVTRSIRWGSLASRSVAVLLLAMQFVSAQDDADAPDAGEIDISPASIAQQIERINADEQLDDGVRETVLTRYADTLKNVEAARSFRLDTRRFERDAADAGKLVAELQDILRHPPKALVLQPADTVTTTQLEQALTQAQADLETKRAASASLEQAAQRRTLRRTEIAKQVSALNQQTSAIEDETRITQQTVSDSLLQRSILANLQAQRRAIQGELEALRAELSSYDARVPLLPLRRDRAQRQVAQASRLVAELEEIIHEKTLAETERYFADIGKQCEEAIQNHPELTELAREVQSYAVLLAGPEGVRVKAEAATRELGLRRTQAAQLVSISQLTRRKFDAAGMSRSATQWFPEIPADFPEMAGLGSETEARAILLPNVDHQRILLEETRAKLEDLETEVEAGLVQFADAVQGPVSPETEELVRELLRTRRELLDSLIVQYTRYFSQLQELDSESRKLHADIEEFSDYLLQRVLWVRSVSGSSMIPIGDTLRAFGWLFANEDWPASLRHSWNALAGSWKKGLAALLLLALLLAARPWLKRWLVRLAEQANREDNFSFFPTVQAFCATLVLAAPLSWAMHLLSQFLVLGQPAEVALAVGEAISRGAAGSFGLLILFEAVGPSGLGKAHLGWPRSTNTQVRAHLRRAIPILLVSIIVATTFGNSLLEFVGSAEEIAFTNSLGRLAFLVFVLTSAVFVFQVLRPSQPLLREQAQPGQGMARRYARVFWLPIFGLVSFLGFTLALAGYYLTAFILVQRMWHTLLIVVSLLFVTELMRRWRFLRRKRLLVKQQEQSAGEAEPELPGASKTTKGHGPDLDLADRQVRQLTRATVAIATLLGMYSVWSDILPSLNILDRISVFPSVALLTEEELSAVQSAPEQTQSQSESASTPTPGALPVAAPAQDSETATERSLAPGARPDFLSLAELLLALIALTVTVSIARDLPGLLEYTVLERLPLDSGDRFAITTIIRYIVLFVGVAIAAKELGLTWSSIQWLAAAFSFGLAFGLQEIFANVVSGLIILIERPMRIGDAVEIGNLSGIVSTIQMRATTITTWNRSELIVPNKEFVTGKLINWTLSNRCARVEVPARVAYGSDVAMVRRAMLEVAQKHPDVLKDPAPYVFFGSFGESALMFELRAYIDYGYGRLKAQDELHTGVEKAFREHGIKFALPQLDLHLTGQQAAGPALAE